MDVDLLWKLAPLVTGVLGYVGGIFSETIKGRLKLNQDTSFLRYSLYAEMISNMDVLETTLNHMSNNPDSSYNPYREQLRFTCHENAVNHQPVIFNRLKEAKTISEIYSLFRSFISIPRSPSHLHAYSQDAWQILTGIILVRRLDPSLLKRVSDRSPFKQPLRYRVKGMFRRSVVQPIQLRPRQALKRLIEENERQVKDLEALKAYTRGSLDSTSSGDVATNANPPA